MPASRRRILIRHFVLLSCIVSLSLLCTACVQPISYQPNTNLLARLTREEATERIRLVLLRASNPQIDEVTVTEEFLNYRIHPTPIIIRIFFGKVAGVEVFDNHAAFVRDPGGQFFAQLFFPTADDAKMFADLLMSLCKVYRAQPRSPGALSAPKGQ